MRKAVSFRPIVHDNRMNPRAGREPTSETIAEFQEAKPRLMFDRESVLALEPRGQGAHFYHALVWLDHQLGKGGWPDEVLQEQIGHVRHGMGAIMVQLRDNARTEGRWREHDWHEWPRNYPGRDTVHLYHTGIMPPQLMAWPPDEPYPRGDHEVMRPLWQEALGWSDTIVGVEFLRREGVPNLRAMATGILESIDATDKAKTAFDKAVEREKNAQLDYDSALWFDACCRTGQMEAWATKFGLPGLSAFLFKARAGQIKEVYMNRETLKIDPDLKRLERELALYRPEEAKLLARYRACIARDSWKPYANA